MPSIKELTGSPRKEMHVFYVLDTSGSMEGERISMLNHCMEECTDALKDLAKHNADAELKIAVLEFNSKCKWVTSNGPELLEDFEWENLSAGGLTDVGAALSELDSKLSTKEFLGSMTGALMPVIIFMTDGYATDDYNTALDKIRTNRWFRRGMKIGFAVGDDADVKMLSSVVGNSEAVIKTNDMALFSKLMKFVAVTSSMLVSKTSTTKTETTGADVVKKAQDDGIMTKKESVTLKPDEYKPEKKEKKGKDAWDDDEDW